MTRGVNVDAARATIKALDCSWMEAGQVTARTLDWLDELGWLEHPRAAYSTCKIPFG